MKFLYIGSFGSEDPTRAGLTFVMAKGAKEAGHDVEIALRGRCRPVQRGGRGERPAYGTAESERAARLHTGQ